MRASNWRAAGTNPSFSTISAVGGASWVRWGPLEIGDVSDATALDRVLQRYRPNCVMYFAALAYVGESMSDPGPYYHVNVTGSLTLLDAMRRHGVNMLVFSSTCAMYGISDVVPLTESHPQRPIPPYGANKLMVEHVLTDYGSVQDTCKNRSQGHFEGKRHWIERPW